MNARRTKTITSWIFVYAALFAAVVLTSRSAATVPPDIHALSPVILNADPPALRIDAVMRRSDI
jgi:hypothetical protein